MSMDLVLVTNQLVPAQDREDVAIEVLYNTLSRKVEALTKRNTALVDSINTVISLIRDKHCTEIGELYDTVARDLDEAMVGLETSVPVTEARESKTDPVQLSNRNVRDHCRKLWRKLAPKLHPDRGGSAELFDMARQAYKANDLQTLLAMEREHVDAKNIGWIRLHGIDYLKERIESLEISYQEVKLSPFMEAYRKWLAGESSVAISMVRQIIYAQIQGMRNQIQEYQFQKRQGFKAQGFAFDDEDLDDLWANAHEVQPPQTDKATTPPGKY